ncbi:MAG: isoprenylcysteine carboxylmethyltransferase family protein [Pseudomonadota bacterium]
MPARPLTWPPLYALAAALLMWVLSAHVPVTTLWESPWRLAGIAFVAAGISIDLWSLALFFRAGTTPHPLRPAEARVLVTGGMYRYTRNPMYLGLLLILGGWAVWLGELSPFLVLPLFIWALTGLQIVHEERALQGCFGEGYADYCRRVRRWL